MSRKRKSLSREGRKSPGAEVPANSKRGGRGPDDDDGDDDCEEVEVGVRGKGLGPWLEKWT